MWAISAALAAKGNGEKHRPNKFNHDKKGRWSSRPPDTKDVVPHSEEVDANGARIGFNCACGQAFRDQQGLNHHKMWDAKRKKKEEQFHRGDDGTAILEPTRSSSRLIQPREPFGQMVFV